MNKVAIYEMLRRQWIANNPDATLAEYEAAMIELAKKAGI